MTMVPDHTCASCHFRVLGCKGYVCGYAGDRVRVEDPASGECAAWRRYFDPYMYREHKDDLLAVAAR